MQLILLSLVFLSILGMSQYSAYKEKQALLLTIKELGKQIKAKDLSEYVKETQPIVHYEPVSLTEEEEYHREIEEAKRH